MSITIRFFAQIREQLEINEIKWEESNISIADLKQKLIAKGQKWARAFEHKNVLQSANHVIVNEDYLIQLNDEIAFFPPVTGG